jgi:hypothetical protein
MSIQPKVNRILITICPKRTTFSPRIRNTPRWMSPYASPWYSRSTVSCRTRLATSNQSNKVRTEVATDASSEYYHTGQRIARTQSVFSHLEVQRVAFLVRTIDEVMVKCRGRSDYCQGFRLSSLLQAKSCPSAVWM